MSAKALHISAGLALPRDAVTSTLVVYGGKGMGKTTFAAVLCEELSTAHLRFSAIDPMGVMWGLRHSKDGKGAGIEVLILGGRHGDIPIEPTGGAVVADLVADEEVNVVIDISRRKDGTMWSLGERIRFVTTYCERLYQRQGERARPLMQIIDEAGRYCPQMIPSGAPELAKCVGAIERMVEEGRNVGIGVALITQRSARMNKSVSELADCMVAFRTVGPRSVDAVVDWFGEHVEKSRWKELVEKLRALPRGTALVVSPGWLEFDGVAAIRDRFTFDSSQTPKAGQERRASGPGAKPDLGRYQQRMAETIERQKADDPRALKKEIAELKVQVAKGASRAPAGEAKTETRVKEVAVVKDAQITRVESLFEKALAAATKAEEAAKLVRESAAVLAEQLGKAQRSPVTLAQAPAPRVLPSAPALRPVAAPRPRPASQRGEQSGLNVGQRTVLTVILQAGEEGISRDSLGVLTGYARSTRDRLLQELHGPGHVVYRGSFVFATDAGRAALPDYEPLPSGSALREHWLSKLPEGNAKVLRFLCDRFPEWVERTEIDTALEYARSTRDRLLQELAPRRVIERQGSAVRASPILFDDGEAR